MLRPTLGDFNSIVCFKAVITGMEDSLGVKATKIALIAAGRARGKNLAKELGLVARTDISLEDLTGKLSLALGSQGTRLCIIDKIEPIGDGIRVYTRETICSAGEPQGSDRTCTYTLGAVWGAIESITNRRLRGVHTESVLRGSDYDIFELNPAN